MNPPSVIAAVLSAFVAVIIFLLVRRDALHVRYSVGWLLLAILMLLGGIAPSFLDWISEYIGVLYPPALGLACAVVLLTIKALVQDVERSKLQLEAQILVQKIVLLEQGQIDLAQEVQKNGN